MNEADKEGLERRYFRRAGCAPFVVLSFLLLITSSVQHRAVVPVVLGLSLAVGASYLWLGPWPCVNRIIGIVVYIPFMTAALILYGIVFVVGILGESL